MPSHVQPRRIIINGHPTSVRLEPAYWGWLREIAAECGLTAKAFIEGVVAAKDPKCPLASALRLYIANYFRSSAPRYGLVDPASRLAFRIERPRRSRKGSKKTEATVEIKPPVQDRKDRFFNSIAAKRTLREYDVKCAAATSSRRAYRRRLWGPSGETQSL